MGRLLTKVPDPSLNQPTVNLTYNLTGQRSTMSDASGATVYGYDIRNRLTSKQTPFGTLSYAYNEAGSLSTLRSSNANGVSADYSYDALNRMATVKDNNLVALNAGVTNYTYDAVGNLQGYSYPNGVSSSYAYNSLNRLTTMTVGTTGASLAGYSYTLGPTGNRTAVTELSGRTVNYSYDNLYRLTGETITSDPHSVNGSAGYSYDLVGNRLNRSSSIAPVPPQTSTYDANDRLTGDNYDNNGNTSSAGGNSYAYDFENHLTSLNGGSVTYVYDGDGNRVAKTVGGVTTNYLIDTNNSTGYAQVVEELQSGSVGKSFTYGHDLVSQRIVGGSLSFYGYDGHGSVRLLTDATAAVTDTYDYDAFGNLISRTGTTPNDYLYSGEQFDANLGFYYLRARYLNPGSGRFLSTDVVEGNRFDPPTLHKYTYVENNPVNLIDPRGEFSVTEALASVVSNAISLCIEYQSVINAARLILAAVNLYELATNERYRGTFLAGGPEFTNAVIADDISSIAAAATRFSGSVFTASSLEPFAVRHATTNPTSVLNGIDPTFANVDSRFGPGFYVAEYGETAVNEVAAHGSSYTYVIRYNMNLNGQRVLDLTKPNVAQAWGYNSRLNYEATQAIAQRASKQGYSVIGYPAVQGVGTNFAVLRNFTEILRPMGVAPGWP
jgi:RHS repeat-associated protein